MTLEDISQISDELYERMPIFSNEWDKMHLADKQLTCFDIDVPEEIIEQFFIQATAEKQQKSQTPILENPEEPPDELENGDISLEAFTQEILKELPTIGQEIVQHHRNNLLNGHITNEKDPQVLNKIYY